jgi:DNA-directed RNA polymerase subunit RPC12/RpoP
MESRMKNHEYTWETLYHFICGECKNWWSYASTETRWSWDSKWKRNNMICPHCGHEAVIQPKPDFIEEKING